VAAKTKFTIRSVRLNVLLLRPL